MIGSVAFMAAIDRCTKERRCKVLAILYEVITAI